ncbi:MAG: metallophosphoesterase [Phycisphaerae bacterium]
MARRNQFSRALLPALLLSAAAARGDVRTFQNGSNGYSFTLDTFLAQAVPSTANAFAEAVEWDADDPPGSAQRNYALLRFDRLFGYGTTQIPPGSTITAATLSYTVFDAGDAGSLYEVAVDWNELTPYNTFGAAPGVQPADYSTLVATAPATIGTMNVNVTASLQRWISGASVNRGWIFVPAGANGCQFRSSEYVANMTLRPKLSVTYTPPATTPLLVRPAYLQIVTPTSIRVAWRTNVATDSQVRFGSAPQSLANTVSDETLVLDHVVTLDTLSPDTLYFYDLGSTTATLAGGDSEHYFRTAPPGGARSAFTAWIVGDSGTGDTDQADVRDALLRAAPGVVPDLYLHMGDMAYSSGTDLEFTTNFFAPYEPILAHVPCWPTMGNHEGTSSQSATQTGPYYVAYVTPAGGEAGGLPSGTEAYYSFDYANVHFICLDSHDSDRTPAGPMLTWLTADLAATQQNWIIAFWHHPPYTKGTHDSDNVADSGGRMRDMRENVLPILEAGGVDLVLAGHSHIYERSFLVDGAYDTPTTAAGHIVDAGDGRLSGSGAYHKGTGQHPHQGAVYVVAGHGGGALGGAGNHPLMYFSEVAFGSCLLTIDGNRLSLDNLRRDGVVTDTFQIVKVARAGDLDCDGDMDLVDLQLFVAVLLGADSDPQHVVRSDMDANGIADGGDVQEFVRCLGIGGCP